MISVFNRRELTTTYSMEEQAGIRDALSAAGIDFDIKLDGPRADTRARGGCLGADSRYPYRFYVRRKDYEKATQLLSKVRHGT